MDVRKFKEAQFDALLKVAVNDCFEAEMTKILSSDEQDAEYTYSERHEQRMKRLFRRETYRETWVAVRGYLHRVAVIIITASALLFGVLMLNDDVRASVKKTLIEWFDTFTRFSFSDSGSDNLVSEWYLGYVPDGFIETESIDWDLSVTKVYASVDGSNLFFTTSPSDDLALAIDNEDAVYDTISVNGILYHLFISETDEKMSHIIWVQDEYVFSIEGRFNQDELQRIAAFVEKR